jgi:hypothetical protein
VSSLAVCHGPSCTQNGGGPALLEALRLLSVTAKASGGGPVVETCGCLGRCATQGANVGVIVDGGAPAVRAGLACVADAVKAVRAVGVRERDMNRHAVEGLMRKEEGNARFNEGDAAAAIGSYAAALAALRNIPGPADRGSSVCAGILCNRSAALLAERRFGDALADANAAVDLRPDLVAAWRRKGDAEDALGRAADAATSLEMAAKLEPAEKKRAALERRAKKLRAPRGWRVF